ncbi:hypothetical protein SteCoe_18600 [Stentor coeruleus]|uniref:Macro domain-containing protein n=1 Tax=Stentor coeruleus TaxID=5963 RepID=A0A1R2BWL4_9CILI|nr:hypothetical protein SteCoe_18600 [Stentor coeruleus]
MNQTENLIIALGEYKDSVILIKSGSPLDELPINFAKSEPSGKFALLSSINTHMTIGGLTEEISLIHGQNVIHEHLNKKHYNPGDVIYIPAKNKENPLRHIILLVLDPSLELSNHQERNVFKENIIKALEEAERHGMEAVVLPGIGCGNSSMSLQHSADVHFEAIEEFVTRYESRGSLKLFSICLRQSVESEVFRDVWRIRSKKYRLCWMMNS